ncbi:hypothetical protein LguiB_002237 [Lonicera macranthoides]
MAESDRKGKGYLILWHFPDSTLCDTRDAANTNPKPEVLKQVKQECVSEDSAVQADLRHQPDMSNGIRTEDWISLRLGDSISGGGHSGGGGPVESTITNGMNLRQRLSSKEGTLDNLADTVGQMYSLFNAQSYHDFVMPSSVVFIC